MSFQTDRNLLIGLLALQSNFISRDQLLDAFRRWVENKEMCIGAILLEQHALDQQTHDLLLALAAKHIELHANQPSLGLDALTSIHDSLAKSLVEFGDPDINQSMTIVHNTKTKTKHEQAAVSPANVSSSDGRSGRFSVIRPHAKGGLGEVFIAIDHELNRQVALKEIQGRYAYDENSRQRFMLEAEITGGLEHPGIVPVYGLGSYSDGRPFYAMRFIKGNSLAEACDAFHASHPNATPDDFRSSDLRKLLQRFVDVCFAIEYAHSRGVLHRDLKPGNIMLGKYGETLVVDWGLAKTMDSTNRSLDFPEEETLRPSSGSDSSHTRMGQVIGTPAYMSPEAAAGRLEEVGIRSDLYCLGATLYFVLTGRAPFHRKGEDSMESIKLGKFLPPRQLNSSIPKPLEAICMLAMKKDPNDRYSSAKRLADDIELWLADEPVSAYEDPLSVRAGRFVRRHKAAVSIAAIFGLLALLGVGLFAAIVSGKNRELAAANRIAEQNRKQAEQQRLLSDDNAATARGIALSITEIAEKQLSSLSGQEGFREDLMNRAYSLFDKVHTQGEDGKVADWELARISRLNGNLKLKLRKMDDAKLLLAQSISLQKKLNRKDKASLDYLAETLRDQASLGKSSGDLQLAATSFEQANEIVDALQRESPDDLDVKRTSGSIDLEQIGLYLDLLKNQEALDSATRCEQVYVAIAGSPSVRDLDYVIAMLGTMRRGQTLMLLDRADEAQEVYLAGIARGRVWLERSSLIDVRHTFARTLLYFSTDLSELENVPNVAQSLIDEAIERYQNLVHSNSARTYRFYLACAYRTRAAIGVAQSQTTHVEADFDKSIDDLEKIVGESPLSSYHSSLAKSYFLKANYLTAKGDQVAAKELLEKAVKQQNAAIDLSPSSLLERQVLKSYEQSLAAIAI